MEGSLLAHDLRKVISLVDLLRDIGLDKQLSLPKVVVLGNQSSGKSSLLQQIVGLDFLPRGSGVVTRRPLQLRMNNVPQLKAPYAQFDQIVQGSKKKQFTNFNQVRKSIDDVTQKICKGKQNIVDIPIVLNIFSPHCPNLTVVDLPGITSIPVGDQPKNIYEITRKMAQRYITERRSIILCVIPANQDLATSQALKLMRQIDPTGERSIGCLTKIDIMNRGDDARNILKNLQIPLRYGYVGIKNRCQEDVVKNIPVSQSLKQQKKFFTTSPIYSTLPPQTFGTQSLTHKLTGILYQQIKSSMPQIFLQIKKKKQQAQQELQKLGPGVANTDAQMVNYAWKSISSFLRIYVNSINGIKNTDYDKDPISAQIRQQLNHLYKDQYDQAATQELGDKDIQKAMINFPGDSTIPGFPSIDAFLALLNPLLKKLQSPAYQINNKIHQIMQKQATHIVSQIMIKKFPQFNVRFLELVRKVLERHRRELQLFLNSLLDAELSYLYTNDVSYLMNDFGLTEKDKKKLQAGKIKDPLIFQLRKRIDSYYKLVVRNLRDLVPKQIFSFLIVKCLKQLQFEAFQFTSDVNKLKQWLNQPAQVRNRRIECIKAIKVFQQSQKKIRMDPQISRLVKNTQKQSKYYKKFGMKTPQQLQQIQNQKRKKQFESRGPPPKKDQKKGGQGQSGNLSRQQSNTSTNTNASRQSKQSNNSKQQKQINSSPNKNAMFNMFGQNVGQKKVQQPPKKPEISNKQLMFGNGGNTSNTVNNNPNMNKQNTVTQGTTLPNNTSPTNPKFQFNFEDAWKAENSGNNGTTGNKTPTQQNSSSQNPVQKPPVVNPPPVNTNNNVPKQQPKQDDKKRATFNNLFGLK